MLTISNKYVNITIYNNTKALIERVAYYEALAS